MAISDETRIKRRLGLGEGRDYKPWFRPRDFSARSRVHRILGNKIEREMIVLSDLERSSLFSMEFDSRVVDIRENYPLLPLTDTQAIAEALSIRHPRNKEGKDVVMTTDFLLTVKGPAGNRLVAVTCKPSDLLTKRTIEKFQIERVYHQNRGVDWVIFTEKQLNRIKCENIARLREYYRLEQDYSDLVLAEFKKVNPKEFARVRDFIMHIAKGFKIPKADVYRSFQHLLAIQKLKFDMNFVFSWDMPLTEFTECDGNN